MNSLLWRGGDGGGGGGGGLVRKQSGYMRFCNRLFAQAKEQVSVWGWSGVRSGGGPA